MLPAIAPFQAPATPRTAEDAIPNRGPVVDFVRQAVEAAGR